MGLLILTFSLDLLAGNGQGMVREWSGNGFIRNIVLKVNPNYWKHYRNWLWHTKVIY